jgi:multidrug efflux pump subunit AcrA (membrane-fusion protein)
MGTVEVALDPIPQGARSGQLSRVTLQSANRDRITIPFNALQRDSEGEFVYTLDETRRAQRTPVKSGLRIADRVEILEGLVADEQVITKGFLHLEPGLLAEPVKW